MASNDPRYIQIPQKIPDLRRMHRDWKLSYNKRIPYNLNGIAIQITSFHKHFCFLIVGLPRLTHSLILWQIIIFSISLLHLLYLFIFFLQLFVPKSPLWTYIKLKTKDLWEISLVYSVPSKQLDNLCIFLLNLPNDLCVKCAVICIFILPCIFWYGNCYSFLYFQYW